MILKSLLPLILLSLSLKAFAALPSATFDQRSFEAIEYAWTQNQAGFAADLAGLQPGSPEASFILGRYMAAAFEGAGYSLDETLYTYTSQAGPGSINMHQFMQALNLGSILIQLGQPELEAAYLQSGAVSQRTIQTIAKFNPDAPITEADYFIEGDTNPFPIAEDASRNSYRKIGRIIHGEDEWQGWIVFAPGQLASGSTYAVGIVETATMDEGLTSILGVLADAKSLVKVQGATVRNPGADVFIDRSQDFLIQTLR